MAGFDSESYKAVITDPPYDLTSDQMKTYLAEFRRLTSGTIIIFAAPENQWPASDQYAFWTKPISTKNTSRRYSRFVEVIHIYTGPTAQWFPNRNWANYVNVFPDFLEVKAEHPFQKPLSLMQRLILNHTSELDSILDPFCGSGTTGVAALRAGRHFTGIEKEKEYAELAQRKLDGVRNSFISFPPSEKLTGGVR